MKSILAASALAAASLFAGMAAAQDPVSLPEAATPVMVTFNDGDGEVLLAGIELDNVPIGKRVVTSYDVEL